MYMKTNIEVRFYIDLEVMEETEYNETQIKDMIMKHSFNEFKFDDFNVVKLDDGTEVNVLPHFNIYNDLLMSVSYF